MIYNKFKKEIILFNDRMGSRPWFYLYGLRNKSLAISPEVQILFKKYYNLCKFSKVAVLEFLMTGSFIGDHTLFSNIMKIPPASIIKIVKEKITFERYWEVKYNDHSMSEKNSDIEELDALMIQAIRRLLKAVNNPILLLSSGIDSRLVLGYLLKENYGGFPLASYGIPGRKNDDYSIAKRIAKSKNLPIYEYDIDIKQFTSHAKEAVVGVDGRGEVIDTPQLTPFVHYLSKRYKSYFNGDIPIRESAEPNSLSEVLSMNRIYSLNKMSRMWQWIKTDEKNDLAIDMEQYIGNLLKKPNSKSYNALKDHIFFETIHGNYLNSFAGAKLRELEAARPFLDEDVVDFLASLPNKERAKKRILKQLLIKKFPDLAIQRPAEHDSLPIMSDYLNEFKINRELREFFRINIIDNIDSRLASIIDLQKYKKDADSIVNGQMPSLIVHSWAKHIPGAWRIKFVKRESRVDSITLLFRFLQLNLYLSNLKELSM